jgi:uncharacterized protein (TIGR00251 family)
MLETSTHFSWQGDNLLLHCYAQPKSSKDELIGIHDNQLKVKITAPPVDGKANAHLCKFLSKEFGVAKSKVTVVKGLTGRQKTIVIINPSNLPTAALITPKVNK